MPTPGSRPSPIPIVKVTVTNITTDDGFANYLIDWPGNEPIDELHIFSHSVGAALSLGYGDGAIGRLRSKMKVDSVNRKLRTSYEEVLRIESGIIFTDDLLSPPFSNNQQTLQNKLARTGFIKLWGCMSAIEKWQYSDEDEDEQLHYEDTQEPDGYYWRALNTRNTPKPALAQAFATFFNVRVYGASHGAHVEVFFQHKWITSQVYKNQFGKYPPGTMPHRLHPDKGTYSEFTP